MSTVWNPDGNFPAPAVLKPVIYAHTYLTNAQYVALVNRTRTVDMTAAIQQAMSDAAARKGDIYFCSGDWYSTQAAAFTFIFQLYSFTNIFGEGSEATVFAIPPNTTQPPAIFGSRTYVRSIRFSGIGFDGARTLAQNQAFSVGTGGYEFSSASLIWLGDDIGFEDCEAINFQGDGFDFGNSASFGGAYGIMTDLCVSRCSFKNNLREHIFVINADGFDITKNYFWDSPYVAGIDLERHNVLDCVRNGIVSGNHFNFTTYKRAISMLVSASGYTADDSMSRDITFSQNKIFNACMDVRSFTSCDILDNKIINPGGNTASNQWISTAAILLQPNGTVSNNVFGKHRIRGNTIVHPVTVGTNPGYAIRAVQYYDTSISDNKIYSSLAGGIFVQNAQDFKVVNNTVQDVGISTAQVNGIQVNDVCDSALILGNNVRDTRGGSSGLANGIAFNGFNNGKAPRVDGNQLHGYVTGAILQYSGQPSFVSIGTNITD